MEEEKDVNLRDFDNGVSRWTSRYVVRESKRIMEVKEEARLSTQL